MRVRKPEQPQRIYVDKNVWKERQPDGGEKWYAIEPETGNTIEIDPADATYYTEVWQAGEREADEQNAAGLGETFDTMEAFLADLNSDDE
ncbi:MAG TPA: hypothetical protein VHD90_07500 [Phototrophicaceae bacterium]|nr:hypothetical protein [Phototrophicaceae bacterium]